MPKVKKLKKLKKGYVRASSIVDAFDTTGAQVKIGGKRYKELVKRRETEGTKRFTSTRFRNQTRALKYTIPSLYKKSTFDKAIRLVKRRHKFNDNDSKIVFNILKDLQEKKTKGEQFLKFTLNDNSNTYLPLNDKTISSLTNTLTDGYFAQQAYQSESDAVNKILIQGIKNVEHGILQPKNMFKSGSFFRYLNTTDINLEKYQIISDTSDIKILDEHCLIYALEHYDIKEELLNRIKTTFEEGSYFPKKIAANAKPSKRAAIIILSYGTPVNSTITNAPAPIKGGII